jgi:hypothetical protein
MTSRGIMRRTARYVSATERTPHRPQGREGLGGEEGREGERFMEF